MAKRKVGRPKKPKSQHKKRNYKREYKKFKSSPAAKKKATTRKRDRRRLVKSGKLKKNDKRQVHHGKGGKVTIISAKKNMGMKEKSRVKGSKRKKSGWGK